MEFFGELLAELRKDKSCPKRSLQTYSIWQPARFPAMKWVCIVPMWINSQNLLTTLMFPQIIFLGEHHLIYHRKFWKRHLWTTSKLAA